MAIRLRLRRRKDHAARPPRGEGSAIDVDVEHYDHAVRTGSKSTAFFTSASWTKPPKASKAANDRCKAAPATRRVEVLQWTCECLAWTADLAGRVDTGAQNGVAVMSRFRKDLEVCRQQCGRLRRRPGRS